MDESEGLPIEGQVKDIPRMKKMMVIGFLCKAVNKRVV